VSAAVRLRIEDLRVAYGGVPVVHGVSLEARDGEFLTLLGPSGCGKSTILRTIAGLVEAEAGAVYIGAACVTRPAGGVHVPPERRDLGMVFQSYAIWPHLTVRENVAYPLRVRRKPQREITQAVDDMLDVVGLTGYAERNATELSGGQQQRVAIARSLVFSPKLLLLDEPLSNLDQKLRLEMGAELRRIQSRANVTAIYVTHDQSEALMLSDRIAILREGRIEAFGTPEDVYERPATPFVSWFVGKANFLPCTVEGETVRIAGSAYAVRPGRPGTADGPAMFSVRPEDFAVSGDGSGIPVVVRERHYIGERRQFVGDFAGTRVEFNADRAVTTAIGETVLLRILDARGSIFTVAGMEELRPYIREAGASR
jgi:iron(III) transport system ATP-binding protein